jgi:hypothetical protein
MEAPVRSGPYRYRVTAVCTATVTEKWTVTSPRPLDAAALDEALHAAGDADVDVACTEEVVSDATNREIVQVETDDEPPR